jgi:hypothetical protein
MVSKWPSPAGAHNTWWYASAAPPQAFVAIVHLCSCRKHVQIVWLIPSARGHSNFHRAAIGGCMCNPHVLLLGSIRLCTICRAARGGRAAVDSVGSACRWQISIHRMYEASPPPKVQDHIKATQSVAVDPGGLSYPVVSIGSQAATQHHAPLCAAEICTESNKMVWIFCSSR